VISPSRSADDVVVGAGIIGLATAWHLARRGRRVAVIERHARARGASVRNFGMIWPIGQPTGPRRQLAMRSRELWSEMLSAAGIWHEPSGSIHLAYHDDELQVLEEFAAEARGDGFECAMIPAADAGRRAPRVVATGLRGALWSPNELVVDPREAVSRCAEWLADSSAVEFQVGTLATGWTEGVLETTGGAWRAERCFICTGDELQVLFPDALSELPLRVCKLQMMRSAPVGWRLGPMLAAGLTLGHYDSFGNCPTRAAVRDRLARELPDHARYGIHVMVSQNGRGELTIGDSHEYGADCTPFDKPEIDTLVLDYLRGFFDMRGVDIASRWHGVYVKHATEPYVVLRPAAGAVAAIGFGGAGMTLSFGAMERVIDSV
jgi:FAD dependent oxidoreductase TIGR03364